MVKDGRHKGTSLSCYHRHPTHNITCEWRPMEQLHPSSTVTLIKVRVLEEPIFYPCTYNRSSAAFTCSSLYREGDSSRHIFYLCVSGRTDSELSANLEATVEDLLHVGPPLNVRVTPVEKRPRSLQVSWRRPEFWQDPFYGLVYQLLYRMENSPHQENGTTAEMSFIIDDAMMGRKHLIRVRAREEFQKNWGSWSEEAVGVPWSDGAAATTLVPRECVPLTSQEEEDPQNEDGPSRNEVSGTPRSWIASCVSLGLVALIFLGLWIRFQEVKLLKVRWGAVRSLFHPSSKATESPVVSPPVVVTLPSLLDGE